MSAARFSYTGSKLNSVDADVKIKQAINEVYSGYEKLVVSVEDKKKSLLKFGRYDNLGTSFETVWSQGGNETFPTGNTIGFISSSETSDTQLTRVEGHTIDVNGRLTFVVQFIVLQGRTKTALSTPLRDVTRIRNEGTTDWAGTIYVYEDDTVTNGVPQTASKIHITSFRNGS